MYHLGDSGQNHIPITRGTAGMKALPSWRRQEISPVPETARLAEKPRNMPNAADVLDR